jgi:hypothetical protein
MPPRKTPQFGEAQPSAQGGEVDSPKSPTAEPNEESGFPLAAPDGKSGDAQEPAAPSEPEPEPEPLPPSQPAGRAVGSQPCLPLLAGVAPTAGATCVLSQMVVGHSLWLVAIGSGATVATLLCCVDWICIPFILGPSCLLLVPPTVLAVLGAGATAAAAVSASIGILWRLAADAQRPLWMRLAVGVTVLLVHLSGPVTVLAAALSAVLAGASYAYWYWNAATARSPENSLSGHAAGALSWGLIGLSGALLLGGVFTTMIGAPLLGAALVAVLRAGDGKGES